MCIGRHRKILRNPGKDPASEKGVYVTLDPILDWL